MGQEFFINSEELESKIRELLPSQGGSGAGFDLSASTQIVPIVDLTESAEGSNVRADLQTALSFTSATAFQISNASTTIINNTGYFRVIGTMSVQADNSGNRKSNFELTDGATTKEILGIEVGTTSAAGIIKVVPVDFIVFLNAGDSLIASSNDSACFLFGSTRQIADINGTLVNPL